MLALNAAALYSIRNIRYWVGRHQAGLPKLGANTYKWYWGFVSFYLTLGLLTAITIYSSYVFTKISPAFGGGRSSKVTFVIKADQVESAKTIGLQLKEDRKLEADMVFEAPDFFLISVPVGFSVSGVKAIRIRKELVDSMLYLDQGQ